VVHSNCHHILYRFNGMTRYWSRITIFSYRPANLMPLITVIHWNFGMVLWCRELQKGLLGGEKLLCSGFNTVPACDTGTDG